MWRTIALHKRSSSESVVIIVISVVFSRWEFCRQNSMLATRRRIRVESLSDAVNNESLIKEGTTKKEKAKRVVI